MFVYVLSDMQIPYNYKIVPFYSFYIEKPEYAFDFAFVYQISRFFRFDRKAKLFADESVFLARIMMRKGTEKGALFRLLLFLLYRCQLPFKHRQYPLSHLPQHPCIVERHRIDCLDPETLFLLYIPAVHYEIRESPRRPIQHLGQCCLPVFDTVDGYDLQVYPWPSMCTLNCFPENTI